MSALTFVSAFAAQARRRLPDACGGNVAIEFAIALPFLILLMLGSVELGRYVLLNQKLDRVAVTMSDLVARAETISQSEIDDILVAAGEVGEPFDLTGSGRVIISAVTNPDGDGPLIAWQRAGAGSLDAASKLGTSGGGATLDGDFAVREGETAIIAEVFFAFAPFLSESVLAPRTLYKRAHHRPRLGTLETVEDG